MFVCKITYYIPDTLLVTNVMEKSSRSNEDAYKKAYDVALKKHSITHDNILTIKYN